MTQDSYSTAGVSAKMDTLTAEVIAHIAKIYSADAFYNQLVNWLNKFDENLDNEHEVGVKLTGLGQSCVFYLSEIHYRSPSLIIFKGITEEENQDVELIQHVNQVSILLIKMPLREPTKPKPKIKFGFQPNQSTAL